MKHDRHPRPPRADTAPVKAARLPEKLFGEHRWVATATHVLTAGEALRLASGGAVDLDDSNRLDVAVSCMDCTTSFDVAAGGRCPVEQVA